MLNYCTDVVSKLATSAGTPVPDPQEPRPGRLQGVETDEGARLPGRRDLGRSEGEVLVRLCVLSKGADAARSLADFRRCSFLLPRNGGTRRSTRSRRSSASGRSPPSRAGAHSSSRRRSRRARRAPAGGTRPSGGCKDGEGCRSICLQLVPQSRARRLTARQTDEDGGLYVQTFAAQRHRSMQISAFEPSRGAGLPMDFGLMWRATSTGACRTEPARKGQSGAAQSPAARRRGDAGQLVVALLPSHSHSSPCRSSASSATPSSTARSTGPSMSAVSTGRSSSSGATSLASARVRPSPPLSRATSRSLRPAQPWSTHLTLRSSLARQSTRSTGPRTTSSSARTRPAAGQARSTRPGWSTTSARARSSPTRPTGPAFSGSRSRMSSSTGTAHQSNQSSSSRRTSLRQG